MNDWAYNPPGVNEDQLYLPESMRMGQTKGSWYWRGPDVRNPHNIPLFFDCIWTDAWPDDSLDPPEFDEPPMTDISKDQMLRICINRHNGTVNYLFLDYSVRKIGLKQLWTLKWHPYFRTDGIHTKAGGKPASEWPQWMRHFKDY
jgi:prepilin-type processing-associated H-X9-DG protein